MKEILTQYRQLKQSLAVLIEKSGYRNSFIAEKIGMRPTHFSTRKLRGNWTEEEISKVLDVIENEELEDFYLGTLMESARNDETITLAELNSQMGWK